MPSVKEWLFGKKDKMKQVSNFTPEQMQMFQQMSGALSGQDTNSPYGQLIAQLQGMLDPNSDIYKNFEAPYMDQFNKEIIPNIGERFAGMGALSSSGFGQALGGAASNLQAQLAGLKGGMQQNAMQQLLGQQQNFMGLQPYQNVMQQGSSGALPGIIGGALGGLAGGGGLNSALQYLISQLTGGGNKSSAKQYPFYGANAGVIGNKSWYGG